MSLDRLAADLHATAVQKGFWDDEVDIHFILAKLALVHSEVSEVLEAVRKRQGADKVVEEMADIIIRLLDLYEGMVQEGWLTPGLGVEVPSLDAIIQRKAEVNRERPPMHGNLA